MSKRDEKYIEISQLIETKPFQDDKTLLYFEPSLDVRNIKMLLYVTISILLLMASYLGYLTIFDKNLKNLYLRNLYYNETLPAQRGLIYTADGKLVAFNEPILILYLEKSDFDQIRNKELFKTNLLAILNMETGVLEEKLSELQSKSRITLAEISQDQAIKLMPNLKINSELPLKILETFRRRYAYDYEFSHIIGYVKRDELNYTGISGIEKKYDTILSGQSGEITYLRDAKGNILRTLKTKKPVNGQDLVLSIDSKLQLASYKIIKTLLTKKNLTNAALIASNPRTGEILALHSFPSFNQNRLNGFIDKKGLEELLKTESLFNRSLSGLYAPGSIFKLLVALGALNEKVTNPYQQIRTPASVSLPSKYDKTKSFTFKDWKDHGWLNLIQAIAQSSNTYFYKLGSGFFDDVKGLGIDKLIYYAKQTVFGQKLNIDLPEEKEGFLPNPTQMNAGDVLNSSIGQGKILTTILQLNTLTNLIANKGYYYQPKVSKMAPNKKVDLPLSQNIYEILHEGMCGSVQYGTSRRIKEVTTDACAKTGTAQISSHITNSLFTIFYPKNNPLITITAIVEGGGEGSDSALTIARELLTNFIAQNNAMED